MTTTLEAGLAGPPDQAHSDSARQHRRVIVTEDVDFLILANKSGAEHWGIVYCRKRNERNIGQIIEFVVLMEGCLGEEDMRNHVEFC